jgi:spore germination protein KA
VVSLWQRLRSIFTHPKRDLASVQFSLGDRDPRQTSAAPSELREPPDPEAKKGEPVPKDFAKAVARLEDLLHYPLNQDLVFREILIYSEPHSRARVLYYEGICDTLRVEREIIEPLMRFPRVNRTPRARLGSLVLETLLPSGSSLRVRTIDELVQAVTKGEVAVLFDTGAAFTVDIKAPPTRQPEQPVTERVTQGPQFGFVESLRANSAMVRRYIHDPDLVLEGYAVGRRQKTSVAVMYIADIANPKLVAEVRQRIRSLDVDGLTTVGVLEQLIEDHPMSLVPTTLNTERPDRVVLHLLQGSVGILADGSPRALVVPITFSTFLHSSEDVYQRYPYASFLRLLRMFAAVVALLAPAVYVAILSFHQEMLPGLILVTLESARQGIPLPLLASVVLMESSFELVREAGVRVPVAIGPTIGIVGALLIGDMAVRANLVSPVTIVVVAVTGLANFALPDQSVAFAIRIGRFAFLGLAGLFGFLGLALGLFVLAVHLASLSSFGVPYLSPVGPRRPGSWDVILRGPFWLQEKRPAFLRPLDLFRQARPARAWDPGLVAEPEGPRNGQPRENAEPPEGAGGKRERDK